MLWFILQSLKVTVILVLAVAVFVLTRQVLHHELAAASAGTREVPITVAVTPNESVTSLAHTLQADGVIRSPLYFELRLRLTSNHVQLRAGTYTLHQGMSIAQILTALTSRAGQ